MKLLFQIRRSLTGFTLLELLIVIVISGILVSMIIPGFSHKYQWIKFENYCYKVVGFLKKAQNKALQIGKTVEVVIDYDRILLYLAEREIDNLAIPKNYNLTTEIKKILVYPLSQLRLISDSGILDIGEIEIHSDSKEKRIMLWPDSGNIFIAD